MIKGIALVHSERLNTLKINAITVRNRKVATWADMVGLQKPFCFHYNVIPRVNIGKNLLLSIFLTIFGKKGIYVPYSINCGISTK